MLLEATNLATALRYLAEVLDEDYEKDPGPLFADAGVPLDRTRQSGARVSQGAARRLWEGAVAATGDPALGLKVGRRVRPEGLHALGYAWMSSRTLAEALQRYCRYVKVLSTLPIAAGVMSSSAGCRFTAAFPDPAQQPHDAGIDASLMGLLTLAERAAGHPVRPRGVSLRHPCRATTAVYQAAFGVPVEFDAATNGLRLDTATAEAVLPTDNPDVSVLMDQLAERYIADLQPQPVATRVRRILRDLLPTGEVGQETVAARLNCSLSTLQRQLQSEGLNYRSVLDATRRSLADAYLREARFSQAEIAYLLGFSDQSNFSRAYRRWTGRSPSNRDDSQAQGSGQTPGAGQGA
jgi:AraC-like DNA-binding protein